MTHPSEMPAGTRYSAGRGFATVLPDADFETYSEAGRVWDGKKWRKPKGASQGKKPGLPVVGAAVYAQHPSTEVLCLAYNLKDGRGKRRWRPGQPLPYDLIEHVRRFGLLEAWNSAFEWWIWNFVCVPKYGFPSLDYRQLRCAMAKARAFSMPGKLEITGDVLNLEVKKDPKGDEMIKLFCVPQDPTKTNGEVTRFYPETHPRGPELYHYNDVDIITESEASARIPDLEGEELEFWLLDQLINRRGAQVDIDSLRGCVAIVERCLERFDGEMTQITGGVVQKCSELQALARWLLTQGVNMGTGKGSMDDEAITAQLARMVPPPPGRTNPARRALELRQLAGSASVKKVFTMILQVSPAGRLHDLFNYHGAHTGRPTGEGPQPTNLPKAGPPVYLCICGRHHGTHARACPWCGMPVPPGKKKAEWGAESTEDCLEVIRTGSIDLVQLFFGDAMLAVSGCVRGLFIAAPGYDLIASDYSSIEGVVTACLAGEDWRVEMFKTHAKAYELSVSKITGIPFAEIMAHAGYDTTLPEWWLDKNRKSKGPHHPMRQTIGKVAELASGFGGWTGAWARFMADSDPPIVMPEAEVVTAIKAWREASPNIVEFWGGQERRIAWQRVPERFGLEGMAINAIENPGVTYYVKRMNGTETGIKFLCDGSALYMILPSGRSLTYHNPRLEPAQHPRPGLAITFERYNTNPQKGPIGWHRFYTYGGSLCENAVQAVARDIQRRAMLRLEAAGYHVVLHVYDEDVTEVPQGWGSIEEQERIMQEPIEWAYYKGEPWPIKAAGGWRGRRYRKA